MQKPASHFLPSGHGNSPELHANAHWHWMHWPPAPQVVSSSTVPSQSSSRQLHCSGSIGCELSQVGVPFTHLRCSQVVPLPHVQQFGPVHVGLGSQTQSSSMRPSQSSSTPSQVGSLVAAVLLHVIWPLTHWVWPIPQFVEQSAGVKSSSIR